MQEELLTSRWLKSTIEAGAPPLKAYLDLIPVGAVLPAVRYLVQTSHDVRGIGDPKERIMVQIDWIVAVVSPGNSLVSLVTLANSLDTALHNTNGSTPEISVLSCVRMEPFSLLETVDSGPQFRHAGGIYRTIVQAL